MEAKVKTITLEVRGLFQALDHLGVEKQLAKLPGVIRVSGNSASETATVEYDEALTSAEELRRAINDCGFVCRGECVPRLPGQHYRRAKRSSRALTRSPPS